MDEYGNINDYFNGLLSSEEAARFDKKIQDDPAFAEEVAFYVQATQQVRNQVVAEKKKRFRKIYEKEKQVPEKASAAVIFLKQWKSMAVAAAIVIVCAITWLFWPATTPAAMADKYIKENFYVLPGTMGETDSLQTAIRLSNDNKLPEALRILEQLARSDPKNETAIKDAGIVCLRMRAYDQALTYFTRLQQMEYLNSNPGKFYIAITLLKRNLPGDKEKAKDLLREVSKNNLQGKAYAEKILKTW